MQLAYLYSRYPVVSQTFCDMEMLELERRGYDLLIGSVHPPLTSLRHEHFTRFRSTVHYAPPAPIMRLWEQKTRAAERWPESLIERHDRQYGASFKAALRARNASYFAELFTRHGINHFHVHFANRAAHTALFVKEISGIPFSITAHGQDFMSDLGQDNLLREICSAAEFVAVETDFSRDLLRERCPDAAAKIHRVYNGLALAELPASLRGERSPGPTRILSIGRLVPFKGFEILLEACAELDRRNFDFRCEIVGDGPLREKLEAMIVRLKLARCVELCGSLSQADVFSKLRSCDIFALASVVDSEGASDVFPTVIMEAMAFARPVVSTRLAGIPESVVEGVTGLLVAPGDWEEFALALDRLVRDPVRRKRLGDAGRARMENEFDVVKTVEPLHQLFSACISASSVQRPKPAPPGVELKQTAYLIDRWPDESLPFLEMELRALRRNGVPHVPFVFCPPLSARLTAKTKDLAMEFQYLPDAMVIEAEWQSSMPLVRELEAMRANQKHRPPSDLFLEQARYAVMLRKLFLQHNVGHVHATNSRSLLCALCLKKLLGLGISVAIEEKPVLSEAVILDALDQCVGGRSIDRELLAHRGSGFLFDQTLERPSVNDIGPWLTRKARVEWTGARRFWREWSQQLIGWTAAHE
ncbi:MAG TPA: glycosyltransferase family 4 protein [Chthoniobacterales bacterium]|nr:glycosyltransferase family 4 protein [Chthoniobacterales bacterium]